MREDGMRYGGKASARVSRRKEADRSEPQAAKRAKAVAKGSVLEKRVSLEARASDDQGCDDREAGASRRDGQRMTSLPEKSFAEFFAGIGLMRIGLERAGWRIAFANDIDAGKWRMYRDHFGETGEFVLGDVHALDAAAIPPISLATASFPCNDLSLAGTRSGLAGEQSSAFRGFVFVLTKMGDKRPSMVLLENVTGFLTSRNGEDFRDALVALNRPGYAVDAFIIDAVRFVPQSRKRLFVVGTKSNAAASQGRPRSYKSDCRPAALAGVILRNPEINWRIRDLPPIARAGGISAFFGRGIIGFGGRAS